MHASLFGGFDDGKQQVSCIPMIQPLPVCTCLRMQSLPPGKKPTTNNQDLFLGNIHICFVLSRQLHAHHVIQFIHDFIK